MQDTTLEADVVVIGSGAEEASSPRELALAGKRVIVLEKGATITKALYAARSAGMPEPSS